MQHQSCDEHQLGVASFAADDRHMIELKIDDRQGSDDPKRSARRSPNQLPIRRDRSDYLDSSADNALHQESRDIRTCLIPLRTSRCFRDRSMHALGALDIQPASRHVRFVVPKSF